MMTAPDAGQKRWMFIVVSYLSVNVYGVSQDEQRLARSKWYYMEEGMALKAWTELPKLIITGAFLGA